MHGYQRKARGHDLATNWNGIFLSRHVDSTSNVTANPIVKSLQASLKIAWCRPDSPCHNFGFPPGRYPSFCSWTCTFFFRSTMEQSIIIDRGSSTFKKDHRSIFMNKKKIILTRLYPSLSQLISNSFNFA